MFTVVAGTDPQVLLVEVTGDLDIETVGPRRAELDQELHAASAGASGRPSVVVIDLRDLTILSAAGLRMLGELAVDLNQRGITTTVAVQPGSLARRLLYLAGLDQRLVVLDASLPTGSED